MQEPNVSEHFFYKQFKTLKIDITVLVMSNFKLSISVNFTARM